MYCSTNRWAYFQSTLCNNSIQKRGVGWYTKQTKYVQCSAGTGLSQAHPDYYVFSATFGTAFMLGLVTCPLHVAFSLNFFNLTIPCVHSWNWMGWLSVRGTTQLLTQPSWKKWWKWMKRFMKEAQLPKDSRTSEQSTMVYVFVCVMVCVCVWGGGGV